MCLRRLLESISQRARSEKVTLNSLLNASMLLAVNRHLYRWCLPAHANLCLYQPASFHPAPLTSRKPGQLHEYDALFTGCSGDKDIWDLSRELHTKIYVSLKNGSKFAAILLSEAMMKMFIGLGSMRMCTTALNYSGSVPISTNYGSIKVTGLHGFVSNFDIGPQLAAQARLFNDQIWWDFFYMDTDMDASLAEKIVAEIQLILEQAVSAQPARYK